MSEETSGYRLGTTPFVQPKHWVVHHPVFTKHPTAMVVYMRLRAAFFEGDTRIRVMTNEQISRLVDFKVSTVRDALRHLTAAGLLVRMNPEKKNAVPLRRFVDEIPEGYSGIVSGLEHRDEVMAATPDKSDNKGDGSSTPLDDQGFFPDEKIFPDDSDEGKNSQPSDQGFFPEVPGKTDNGDFLGDGTSAPGDGTSTPGVGSATPQGSKTAGQDACVSPQEAPYEEAPHQEALSGSAGDALARGACAPGDGSDDLLDRLLEEFAPVDGEAADADGGAGAAPVINLPGGGAVLAGRVLGPAADEPRTPEKPPVAVRGLNGHVPGCCCPDCLRGRQRGAQGASRGFSVPPQPDRRNSYGGFDGEDAD
jgi:hypothetical protein